MTEKHDFAGCLKALEDMPKDDVHERVIWRWFSKYYSEIRAALTAAKGGGWLPIDEVPYDEYVWMGNAETGYMCYDFLYDAGIDYLKTLGYTHFMRPIPLPKPPQDGGDDE